MWYLFSVCQIPCHIHIPLASIKWMNEELRLMQSLTADGWMNESIWWFLIASPRVVIYSKTIETPLVDIYSKIIETPLVAIDCKTIGSIYFYNWKVKKIITLRKKSHRTIIQNILFHSFIKQLSHSNFEHNKNVRLIPEYCITESCSDCTLNWLKATHVTKYESNV